MPIHYSAQNLLFAELLHRLTYINGITYVLISILCPFLLWQISKYFFKKHFALIPATILVISPWFWYLVLAQSFYIYLFSIILVILYGVLVIRSGRTLPGSVLIVLASTLANYSSPLFLFFVPILFVIFISTKILSIKQLRYTIVAVICLSLPLVLLINKNRSEFKNSFINEVRIFHDPSLLNSINRFQGGAERIGLRSLSRISENKYLFFSEYILLKYGAQLVPETFFTPQYKLLEFSFSPPLLTGLIIPFAYGLYLALKRDNLRKVVVISTILAVPSVLANEMVALNRLILFSPVVILIISYGLINLWEGRKNVVARNFLIVTSFLAIFQMTIMVNDIRFREQKRLIQYFGNQYEISEP